MEVATSRKYVISNETMFRIRELLRLHGWDIVFEDTPDHIEVTLLDQLGRLQRAATLRAGSIR